MRTAALWLAITGACGDNGATVQRDASPPDEAVVVTPDASAPVTPRKQGFLDGACTGQPGKPRVLVYTYENYWRHASNLTARATWLGMCATRGFNVSSSNDPHVFNAEQLAQFDVVVFSVTSGSGIDDAGKADFEAWVHAGGGVVGLEAATATEFEWTFYVEHMGAAFRSHPPELEHGTLRMEPVAHPITAGLPATLRLTEQWYVFQSPPENVPGLTVLMTLDESTLPATHPPDLLVGYHAYAWVRESNGGRVFYTALGDNPEIFANATVLELMGRAIEWTAHQL